MATIAPIVREVRAVPQLALQRASRRSIFLWTNGLALLVVAVFLRCWHLGNIPGINGDEAWYGVQALRVASGQSISWLTPTGNPINPFYFLPLVVLHYFLSPSVVVLRVVALASGLAALAINYALCRRAFDLRTARVSTLLLALLPVNVAYSRFGWDASQSLAATLLVMYLPLVRLRDSAGSAALGAGAMFAAAAAILVHPTNVFALALVLVPVVYVHRKGFGRTVRRAKMPAKTWAFALLVAVVGVSAWVAWQCAPLAIARLNGPREIGPFLAGYLRLFSGTTVYQFITGAGLATPETGWYQHTTVACNLGFGLLGLWALWGFALRIVTIPTATDACLAWGWLLMLAAFFLVAGPRAMSPHFERYAICLIAPGALVVSRGLCWWMDQSRPDGNRLVVALALAAWLWPASYYVNYFRPFLERGGMSHATFRTGEADPKQSALQYVLAERDVRRPVEIVCHEWWSYWPLAYLAFREPDVHVVTSEHWHRATAPDSDRSAETWFVEFGGSTGERDALRAIAGTKARRHAVLDYGLRPTIWVIGPVEKLSPNY